MEMSKAAVSMLLFLLIVFYLSSLIAIGGYISASNILYVYSDDADLVLFSDLYALSDKTYNITCHKPFINELNQSRLASFDLILLLDLNLAFMERVDKVFFLLLEKYVEHGGRVVLGLNTLRLLNLTLPEMLEDIGIKKIEIIDGDEVLTIAPSGPLESFGFNEEFNYPLNPYKITVLSFTRPYVVVLESTDGLPIVVKLRHGKGEVIILPLNIPWYYYNTRSRGALSLVNSVIYYALQENSYVINPYVISLLVASAALTASLSLNPRIRHRFLRVFDKTVVFIVFLGYRTLGVDVLKNPIRKKIFELLDKHVYLRVKDIMDLLGISRTTALWHISLLERAGLIESEKVLGVDIWYKKPRRKEAILDFLLESATRRKILRLLLSEGAMTLTSIAKRVGISKSTAKHNIDVLLKYSIVYDTGTGYAVNPEYLVVARARNNTKYPE
jgi:DNA-binding transcriptional ArsR family regulator